MRLLSARKCSSSASSISSRRPARLTARRGSSGPSSTGAPGSSPRIRRTASSASGQAPRRRARVSVGSAARAAGPDRAEGLDRGLAHARLAVAARPSPATAPRLPPPAPCSRGPSPRPPAGGVGIGERGGEVGDRGLGAAAHAPQRVGGGDALGGRAGAQELGEGGDRGLAQRDELEARATALLGVGAAKIGDQLLRVGRLLLRPAAGQGDEKDREEGEDSLAHGQSASAPASLAARGDLGWNPPVGGPLPQSPREPGAHAGYRLRAAQRRPGKAAGRHRVEVRRGRWRREHSRVGVDPAGVQKVVKARSKPAPDDHLRPRPHRRVAVAGRGSIREGCRRPSVSRGVVDPAGVGVPTTPSAAPDDHPGPSPHRRVACAGGRGPGRARCRPHIRRGIVDSTGVGLQFSIVASPHDHLRSRPHRRGRDAGRRSIREGHRSPCVGGRVIHAAAVHVPGCVYSRPDDHSRPGPHGGVVGAGSRGARRTRCRPRVPRRVVDPAGIQIPGWRPPNPPHTIIFEPVHTAVCPDAARGSVLLRRRHPCVGGGVVDPASLGVHPPQ